MKKLKLTQAEIDKLVTVGRVESNRRVFGAGVNNVDFEVVVEGDHIWQYLMWKSMIQRCFSEKFKMTNLSYKDVTCCDEWLSFGNFLAWCNKEVGYRGKPVGMALDKDLLIRCNKIYSPEACSFVPRDVNVLLTDHRTARGEYPQGVSFHKQDGRYKANVSCWGVKSSLGSFKAPEEAFAAYKIAKEAHVKIVATQHRDSIKPAVYEALMNWKVEE